MSDISDRRSTEVDALRREVHALRTQVDTATAAAQAAHQRADDAARGVLWSMLAIGLSFGIALTLIVLAVIPGGQL